MAWGVGLLLIWHIGFRVQAQAWHNMEFYGYLSLRGLWSDSSQSVVVEGLFAIVAIVIGTCLILRIHPRAAGKNDAKEGNTEL